MRRGGRWRLAGPRGVSRPGVAPVGTEPDLGFSPLSTFGPVLRGRKHASPRLDLALRQSVRAVIWGLSFRCRGEDGRLTGAWVPNATRRPCRWLRSPALAGFLAVTALLHDISAAVSVLIERTLRARGRVPSASRCAPKNQSSLWSGGRAVWPASRGPGRGSKRVLHRCTSLPHPRLTPQLLSPQSDNHTQF